MTKRFYRFMLPVLGGLLVLAFLNPINNTLSRLILVGLVGTTLLALIFRLWPLPRLRWVIPGILLFLGSFLALPSRDLDAVRLRQDYVTSLRTYKGAPYLWGGEGHLGIDCSGLPRKSLRDALWKQGLLHLNPGALRQALDLWWNDTSARTLQGGIYGLVRPLSEPTRIRSADSSILEPGDLAITENGVHMLVYLGNDEWIQADPGEGKVLSENGKTSQNYWFDSKVSFLRWNVFP